jgi:hypothetical protein
MGARTGPDKSGQGAAEAKDQWRELTILNRRAPEIPTL